ncbi:TetR family transcriptional regulator [Leifsonia sp. F6_8S_P_1B]|uniref:TetR family transcriptional regulator n=1 Tax=Leifsonia williamsii TaxID=3035919 RepID=A0ABT8KBI3_9MICO|nr:TetR family transcriptional regulator [Leifsonia williamsii]MDN4614801.1 TetR family transcriptional regulator [Leifsonia williamsii]
MSSPDVPSTPAPRRRGRPADVDPDAVALVALRHFDAHGYDETTMDDIAAAAGVSRRTLFRYFPSKPALVWGGMEPVVERMRAVFDAAGETEPVRDVLARAFTESLDLGPDRLEATRRRLRLMAAHPALVGFGITSLAVDRDLLCTFLARRLRVPADGLRAQVLADALTSANFSALLWWAQHDDGDPARIAVAALDEVLRGPV